MISEQRIRESEEMCVTVFVWEERKPFLHCGFLILIGAGIGPLGWDRGKKMKKFN